MQFNALALSSLLISAPVLSFAAPAANAQNFTPNAGGIHGLCDSGSAYRHTSSIFGSNNVGGSIRNCRAARKWASREGARNRRHDRNSQYIGIGANLLTGLILNSQQRKAEPPAPSTSLKAEMALMKQQQEIELLKLQLQSQQAQQAQYGAPARVQYVPVRSTFNVAPRPYAY